MLINGQINGNALRRAHLRPTPNLKAKPGPPNANSKEEKSLNCNVPSKAKVTTAIHHLPRYFCCCCRPDPADNCGGTYFPSNGYSASGCPTGGNGASGSCSSYSCPSGYSGTASGTVTCADNSYTGTLSGCHGEWWLTAYTAALVTHSLPGCCEHVGDLFDVFYSCSCCLQSLHATFTPPRSGRQQQQK